MEGNELVKIIIINHRKLAIYGCWDSQTMPDSYDFYDVYDNETGECMNEGEPFYSLPSEQELSGLVDLDNELRKK